MKTSNIRTTTRLKILNKKKIVCVKTNDGLWKKTKKKPIHLGTSMNKHDERVLLLDEQKGYSRRTRG